MIVYGHASKPRPSESRALRLPVRGRAVAGRMARHLSEHAGCRMNLDKHFPPSGPCALCGDPDARHRLFDAIKGRYEAGEPARELALDYDVSVAAILAVLATSKSRQKRFAAQVEK